MAAKKTVFLPRILQELHDTSGQLIALPALDKLNQLFRVVDEQDLERDPALLDDIEGVALSDERWPHYQEVIPRMPNLRAVVVTGTGMDLFADLVREKIPCLQSRRDLAIGNCPGAGAVSTANMAISLVLAVARRLMAGKCLCCL